MDGPLCEIHCCLCPHIFFVYYFRLSQCGLLVFLLCFERDLRIMKPVFKKTDLNDLNDDVTQGDTYFSNIALGSNTSAHPV